MRSLGAVVLFANISLGLILGFAFANISHRNQSNPEVLPERTQVKFIPTDESSETASQISEKNETLSENELRQAVKRADTETSNTKLQRELGLALFRYAALKQNTQLLLDAVRLMRRARPTAPLVDRELLETLGDGLFVLAQENNNADISEARAAYQQALKSVPNNVNLLVKVGDTFYYEKPANLSAALEKYNFALTVKPDDEKALESLIRALLTIGKTQQARNALERLRQVNSQNVSLMDLETRLSQQQLSG